MNFKKFIFCAMGLLVAPATMLAQTQLPDMGFENWTHNGTITPDGWNNIGTAQGAAAFLTSSITGTTAQSTDVRPGSVGQFSAQLTSKSLAGFIVNGTMTTGRMMIPSTSPAAGYTQTQRANAGFNQSFTGKPNAIRFWAKYSVTSSGDNARVSAIIHDDYDMEDPSSNGAGSAANDPHIVGTAVQNFKTGGKWQLITVPFTYSGPATNADYILITFSSSATPGAGVEGATLLLDDVEMVYDNQTFSINSLKSTGLTTDVDYNPNTATNVDAVLNVDHIPATANITATFDNSGVAKNSLIKAWAHLPAALGGAWVQIEPFDLNGQIPSTEHGSPYAIDLSGLFNLMKGALQVIPIPSDFTIRVVATSGTTQPTLDMTTNGTDTDVVQFNLKLTDDAHMATNEVNFKNFSYYPNPVQNQLNLRSADRVQKVEFYNMNGQKVLDTTPDSSNAQIGVTGLVKGVYIMKVTVNGTAKTFKVVKE